VCEIFNFNTIIVIWVKGGRVAHSWPYYCTHLRIQFKTFSSSIKFLVEIGYVAPNDFFCGKFSSFCDFFNKEYSIRIPFFWAYNMKERVLKYFYFHFLVCCQICLIILMEYHHLSNITKLNIYIYITPIPCWPQKFTFQNVQIWYVKFFDLQLINVIWCHHFPFTPQLCTSWHTSSKRDNKTLHHNPTIAYIIYKVDISDMRTQVILSKDRKQ
jgi:hypothetical protein